MAPKGAISLFVTILLMSSAAEPTRGAKQMERHRPNWYVNLADFANMVKAFIGSNYLTVAYAFSKSGLIPGAVGMLLIAGLTDHCCHLIVNTKHYVIKQTKRMKHDLTKSSSRTDIHEQSKDSTVHRSDSGVSIDDESKEVSSAKYDVSKEHVVVIERESAEEYMLKHMSYGDVGKQCYGDVGLGLVNFFIALTQFGFCTAYFIFIGNTIQSLFPIRYCYPHPVITSENCDVTAFNSSTSGFTAIVPDYRHNFEDNVSTIGPNISFVTSTTSPNNVTLPLEVTKVEEMFAPSLILLVASPLPIFVVFALVRNVRYLGVVSVIANISILGGCVAVFGFLLNDFEIHETITLANWDEFFVFFGMVTGAFEGIGLVIPVESSMVGNRHLFPCFLHGALFVLTAILATFGSLGYLKFGSEVDQMLNRNIPAGNPLSVVVNVGICVGILLTFPLQIFPVIEIVETYLFTKGRICGPSQDSGDGEQDALLKKPAGAHTEVTHIPKTVSTWKRNGVRVLIVFCACGLAILLRDYYAYVGALIGSLGSSILAFVLPCLFHLKLCWRDINVFIKVKDIVIIIFGVVASIACIYGVATQIASGTVVH